jgi:hypothetical protein
MAEISENPAEFPTLPQKEISKTKVYIAVIAFMAFLLISAGLLLWLAFIPDPDLTQRWRLMPLTMAAALLIIPVWFAWVLIRRKRKTGQWGPTEQERQEMRVKLANQRPAAWLRFVPSWLKNESTDPRGLKLILAVFTTTLTVFIVTVAIRHHVHGLVLLSPAILLLLTANSIWDLYRKPKRTSSSADTPSN